MTKDSEIIHVQWNGKAHNITKKNLRTPFFITSSSERVDEVIKHREKEFNNFTSSYNEINEDLILNDLHLKQGEENNRSSILMQREHTHTKSITQIITTDNTADMFYWTEDKLPLNVFKNTTIHEYISLNNK